MNIGFAVCGSFCTYEQMFPVMESLRNIYTLTPIFSHAAYTTDSRFGRSISHIERAKEICNKEVLHTIEGTVPTLKNMPAGCRFCDRCAKATDRCRQERPDLYQHGDRSVRCFLYEGKDGESSGE